MSTPEDELHDEMQKAWITFLENLEKSIALLEHQIKEAQKMSTICTEEWCEATEHYIDDLSNALFSIREPRISDKNFSQKLKYLKRKIHDLYAAYIYASQKTTKVTRQ